MKRFAALREGGEGSGDHGHAGEAATPTGAWRRSTHMAAGHVEEVPISFLMKFTGPPPGGTERTLDAGGIDDPLVLEVDFKKGLAVLGDGRHRLFAAQGSGYDNVPVRVKRADLSTDVAINGIFPRLISLRARPDDHGRFAAHMKPSDALDFQPPARESRGRRFSHVTRDETSP